MERLENTLLALQSQTIRDRLEIILIVPSDEVVCQEAGDLLDGFQHVQVVAVGPIGDVTSSGANGVGCCRADVLAFVEDHAYPSSTWAESLLRSHDDPWAAVGSTFVTANPHSVWGWASQLISYGPYTVPVKGGEVNSLPAHNVSYKRKLLLALDQPLQELMTGWGGDLNVALTDRGYRLFLDAEAVIYHRNTSVVLELLHMAFVSGRYYAGRRWQNEGWSVGRRVLYIMGSPLIPFKRGYELWQDTFQGKDRSELLSTVWIALGMLIAAETAGQAVGFFLNEGDAAEEMAQHELVDRRTIS